ncbi:MAG: ORF6N domain-containing protein [Candidatus Omnitrophica bacterium]|nr:ORF6N domain-containing protein [Candidatus Omnitrophota bacterium]
MERFPEYFMYQLTIQETEILRCQFGTSKQGGIRYLSCVFTQEGVAILSIVLNSERAILVIPHQAYLATTRAAPT